ncbi:ATP synthase [Armillaria novae-zelandiae]|uniref:ATP synthase subunit 4 n=1 Tax=Armillaria novae-zelandiae TaxID=153914 RepID=A0AA39UGK4_9AGAR|nr:ATP synthase [Armillaria novae-zelandiae]
MAMASRLALRALARPHPRIISSDPYCPPKDPDAKASEIINKLPSSPGLLTKTGTAILGTGLTAAAISQELYVVNEETVLLVGSAIFFTFLVKAIKEPYVNWAEGHISRIKKVLDSARAEHTQAVKERIDSVGQMKDVVQLTQGLFSLSKETVTLEASTFALKQKTALAAELKSVLDSWVRYEQQQKESEQAELTKTVIDNVMKSISDPRVQKDTLTEAVAEIERLVKAKAV